ncbi:MAG: hypothetical protein IKZ78_05435 [Firmicutes bacterium]|nr:hypothetical protein [Bacillota bacterium]
MEFEIAKKLEKLPANIKGNSLRSIKGDFDACQMIIVADKYGDIKNAVESYKMLTNADITFRMRGKSIDVSVMGDDATAKLFDFAKMLSFNSEDAMDVIEFFNAEMPLPNAEFVEIDMDQTRLKLIMRTEELRQDEIMAKLDKYSMGIVKNQEPAQA